MNKSELIEHIAEDVGLTKADAERALNSVTSGIIAELKNGGQVVIIGFGTFKVSHRAARAGRNPQTGEVINIAAANVPVFKAGRAFKDAVNDRD